MITSFSLFLFSFVLLWIGSGLAVNSVAKISQSLKISSFFVSFFVLGLFTSITEIMVGVNAVLNNQPEIFVGNLMGSSVVIFLLVIPFIAVFGNGVRLNHSFQFKDLVSAVLVVGLPALLTIDNRLSLADFLTCVIIYAYFVYAQEKRTKSFGKFVTIHLGRKAIYISFAKILIAVALVFFGSNLLVDNTSEIATILGVSPFLVSILVISVGTNIPEMSIAFRSLLAKRKDIAFGNYVGSSCLNTLEIGVLGLLGLKPVSATGSNYSVTAFLLGLAIFIYFAKSKSEISRKEGIVMLCCYVIFVVAQILTGPGWEI